MRRHDEAAATPSLTTVLASDSCAPGIARRELEGFVPDLQAARMHEARVVVTELVTNSVRHAPGGSIEFTLRLLPAHLAIAVTDGGGSTRPELVARGDAAQPHGWGLRLVESLTESWGVRETAGTQTVWCELRIGGDHSAGGS